MREPGRGIFWGASAPGAALRMTGAGAAAGGAATAAVVAGADWPDTIAKNAFCAASLAASCDGVADVGVSGGGLGRITVKGPAGMVNGSGPQTAAPASTQG